MKAKYTIKFTSQATVQSSQLSLIYAKKGKQNKGVSSSSGTYSSNSSKLVVTVVIVPSIVETKKKRMLP